MKVKMYVSIIGLAFILLASQVANSAGFVPDKGSLLKNKVQPRVVGGRREMDPSVVMWQALFLEKGSVVCGGSLISHNKALTAAHCLVRENDDKFVVRIGGERNSDGKKFVITKTFRHENFTRGPFNTPVNDLMIVEFYNRDKKLGKWAPRLNEDPTVPHEDMTLTTSGYGRVGVNDSLPGHLRSANVPFVSHEICAQTYDGIIEKDSLCAGNESFDSCKGDSGGPLWTRSDSNGSEITLIALVSYGYGCASPNAPGVYARVSGYNDWIEQVKRFPDTEYSGPGLPTWAVILIACVLTTASIVAGAVIVVCVVRKNGKPETHSGGGQQLY